MLIGYMRVSKTDGSQVLDLQMDALMQAGVVSENMYQDFASGKNDDRRGLDSCLKALREGDTFDCLEIRSTGAKSTPSGEYHA